MKISEKITKVIILTPPCTPLLFRNNESFQFMQNNIWYTQSVIDHKLLKLRRMVYNLITIQMKILKYKWTK